MDPFILLLLVVGGAIVISIGVAVAVEMDAADLIYELLASVKENSPVASKTEYTLAGRAGEIVTIALYAFAMLGGIAAAIIGGIETWRYLPWIPATFITIGIASVVIGVCAHVFVED
jgi:hypothetical protein